ncbi:MULTISPECIES: hypothetical protein [Shewanella]
MRSAGVCLGCPPLQ